MPPATRADDDPLAARRSRRFGRDRRLRRPADFAAVLAAPRAQSLRAARQWLAMTAAWSASEVPVVRFGGTVGKRNARRAVDRALVKRVLREASRHAAPALESVCAARNLRLDVSFRLKARRGAGAPAVSSTAWRRALRDEADALLLRLARHLDAPREATQQPEEIQPPAQSRATHTAVTPAAPPSRVEPQARPGRTPK